MGLLSLALVQQLNINMAVDGSTLMQAGTAYHINQSIYFHRSYVQDMENVMCIINSNTSITVNILQLCVTNIDRKIVK
jgi:hypothetical protein